MVRARWTTAAQEDLEEIVVYIAVRDRRRSTARKIYREIKRKCNDYADAFAQGTIGTARSDLGANCRVFTYKAWVIVFKPVTRGIEVLRVLHGARDYPHFFG